MVLTFLACHILLLIDLIGSEWSVQVGAQWVDLSLVSAYSFIISHSIQSITIYIYLLFSRLITDAIWLSLRLS